MKTYELKSSYLPDITPARYQNILPTQVVREQAVWDRGVRWQQLQTETTWLSRYNMYYWQRLGQLSPVERFLATPENTPQGRQYMMSHKLYQQLDDAINNQAERERMRLAHAKSLEAFYRIRRKK